MRLEVELWHARGQRPTPDEYAQRFHLRVGELRTLVAQVLLDHDEQQAASARSAETVDQNRVADIDTWSIESPRSRLQAKERTSELRVSWDAQSLASSLGLSSVELAVDGMLGYYRLERVLGRGGMGVVVRVHDTRLRREVAIKILAPEFIQQASAKERFLRWLIAIIEKLMAKSPDERFQSAAEVAELLGRHVHELQMEPSTTDRAATTNAVMNVAPPAVVPTHRRQRVVILTALMLVGIAIAALGIATVIEHSNSKSQISDFQSQIPNLKSQIPLPHLTPPSPLVKLHGMQFVLIPPDEFTMGSSPMEIEESLNILAGFGATAQHGELERCRLYLPCFGSRPRRSGVSSQPHRLSCVVTGRCRAAGVEIESFRGSRARNRRVL